MELNTKALSLRSFATSGVHLPLETTPLFHLVPCLIRNCSGSFGHMKKGGILSHPFRLDWI
jgi:hypothetical protein